MRAWSHWLYPRFTWRQGLGMLAFGLVGAGIAGVYGVLHDQITYTLSREYFTRFKFEQFDYLDGSLPPRVRVAQIGFLATWWVGFFAGWFMGRVTLPHLPLATAARLALRAVVVMVGLALAAGLAGGVFAPQDADRLQAWQAFLDLRGVTDPAAFVRVGWIHNGSYLGALLGLILALLWLRRERRQEASSEGR